MSTTILPPEFRAPLPGSPAPGSVPATVPNPPPPLLSLAVGSLLTGTVVKHDEAGHFLVRTEHGTFPLSTRAPLEPGAQVTLQVRTRGTQLHVTVTQIDGQPAHLRLSQALAAPQGTKPTGPEPTGGGQPLQSAPSPGASASALQADRISLSTGLPSTTPDATGAGARPGPHAAADSGHPRPLATLEAPTRIVQALTQGTARAAVVVASPDGGQLRLKTALGTFAITTDADIAPGTRVQILLRSLGPPPLIALEPAFASGRQGPPPAQPAAILGRNDVLTLGQPLRAIVQAPSPVAPPGVGRGSALPIGASLDVRILPAGQAASNPGTAAPPPASPGPTSPSQAPTGTQATGPVASGAVTGQAATPILSSSDPGTTAQPTPTAAGRTTGVVVGASAQGKPQLQTPLGLLALELRTTLPLGTAFDVELVAPHRSPLTLGERPATIPLTQTWPALQDTLDLLRAGALPAQAVDASLGTAAATHVPQPGPRLTSSLLFFLAALTGGDPGAWLQGLLPQRAREALETQGRGDLLSRLVQDAGQLGRLGDLAGPDWRFIPVPLYDGQQLQQLRLFLRRRQKRRDGGGERPGEATRFIVEVRLQRLGDLQLDGLVKAERFDLMLRTRRALSPVMRVRITEIFEAAKAAAGYRGNVGFQASDDWSPMPLADGVKGGHALLV